MTKFVRLGKYLSLPPSDDDEDSDNDGEQRLLNERSTSDFNKNIIVDPRHGLLSPLEHYEENYKFKFADKGFPRSKKRKALLFFIALSAVFLVVMFGQSDNGAINVVHYSHVPGMKGYLVWSDQCKIPDIDPYKPEVMRHFKRGKYKPCNSTLPLTRAYFNDTTRMYMLQVVEEAASHYGRRDRLKCCYMSIERNYTEHKADTHIAFGECINFKSTTTLPPTIDNVMVECKVKQKLVYRDGFALMPERVEIMDRLGKWLSQADELPENATATATAPATSGQGLGQEQEQAHGQKQGQKEGEERRPRQKREEPLREPISVLMIGIDSVSRTNLIRAMPKTAQYLYDNEWFELSGYNKIGDNTFPNLMAVLSGFNMTDARALCKPTEVGGLDKCDIIWKAFQDHGFVTAYGEDIIGISTFNFNKKGFLRPPVDHYLRPFMIMAEENFRVTRLSGLPYCLGLEHASQYVFNYGIELARRYKGEPHFGLFWMNSFSHNGMSDCSTMDAKIEQDFQQLASIGAMDNTIIIFFSDHGMRFGPARTTFSGHLEERLPFLFIWLPAVMKHQYPEFVNALNINKNRLTNPYDLHMTLKHILELTGRVTNQTYLTQSRGCPSCQTLFRPVPRNRTCHEIHIDEHWCTCTNFQSIYKESPMVYRVINHTLRHINFMIKTHDHGKFAKLCVPLTLRTINDAFRDQHYKLNAKDDTTMDLYRVVFETSPNGGIFESTVRHHVNCDDLEITGDVSRLNTYADDSKCISDSTMKLYCSCRDKMK